MAITLFTGTPGSGKSADAVRSIIHRARAGGRIICNFPVRTELIKKNKGIIEYWDNSEITPEKLMKYAFSNHKQGREGQTLVIIDEAQILFNCRAWGDKNRNEWIRFFSLHRHLGFNFLLIAQSDRMLDRQIRVLIETQVVHRKLNNYGFLGWFLGLLMMNRAWFIAIESWYGGNGVQMSKDIFVFKKIYSELYDSYKMFDAVDVQKVAGNVIDMKAAGGASS